MTNSEGDDDDNSLMRELRIKDEKLTKEMYDAVLNPTDMLNVLLKKFDITRLESTRYHYHYYWYLVPGNNFSVIHPYPSLCHTVILVTLTIHLQIYSFESCQNLNRLLHTRLEYAVISCC
jgi:hypothetical protein